MGFGEVGGEDFFFGVVGSGGDVEGGFWDFQGFAEQFDEFLVGFALFGGGGEVDFEGAVEQAVDGGSGGAGDHFDGETNTVFGGFNLQSHEDFIRSIREAVNGKAIKRKSGALGPEKFSGGKFM